MQPARTGDNRNGYAKEGTPYPHDASRALSHCRHNGAPKQFVAEHGWADGTGQRMKAVCDTCGARYRIPDEKAAGKVLQIRCRKCGNIFSYSGSSAARRAPKGDWFFAIDGESFGPYTERELLTRFESGKLGLNTHVWKEGFSDWMPVSEHPEFAAAIELSKDSMRRLGAQRPQSHRTTEGSGRFTVDIRRPGATVDEETQAQQDALNEEVDNAFQSLMGQPADREDDAQDELTPTTPMRVFSAQKNKDTADTAIEGTEEHTRPAVTDAAAAPNPRTQTPKKTPVPRERLSLSERLRKIREESAEGVATTTKSSLPSRKSTPAPSGPSATPKQPAKPRPQASAEAPASSPRAASPDGARTDDVPRSEDDTPTGPNPALAASSSTERPKDVTPISNEAVAPIPSGPIRQVTQEINIDDLFDGDGTIPAPAEPAAAVPVPSDEDLKAHLSKRKEARARGDQPTPADDPDTPPFILDDAPNTPKASARSERPAARTPYKMDGVTDVHDDEPPYILDGPGNAKRTDEPIRHDDVTPVGGTAAVPTTPQPTPAVDTAADEPAADEPPRKRRGLVVVILLLLLLILALAAGWFWLQMQEENAAQSTATTEEDVAQDAPIDRSDFIYARNRALGVVAQARGSAESAAFVASSDVRNRDHKRRNSAKASRGESARKRPDTPIEFHTSSASNTQRLDGSNDAPTAPSKALFADTLKGAVSSSVGRCAQRTLGQEGFLPVSRLELSITIAPDGTVQQTKGQREAHSGPLMRCIQNESQRWSFPKFAGKATTISSPYVLN